MNELGYQPYKVVPVGEDLLYKYSKLWTFTKQNGVENEKSLLDNIMLEDVGVEIHDVNISHPEYCVDLKRCLKDLLNNKKQVKKDFASKVKSYGKVENSGRNVGMLMKKSLENLIPAHLLGGKQNKNQFVLNILKALAFGNKDALPIKMFMNGIKLKHIQWFRTFKTASLKVKTYFTAKLVLWLWRITKKFVTTQYYVSEMQGSYNRLVFIYKSKWQQKTDRAFKCLVDSGSLRCLDSEEAKKMLLYRQPAKLRWLPKKNGLRPIIYVRNDKGQGDIICAKVFLSSILKLMEKDLTIRKLQEKWKEVVTLRNSLSVPQLYFVTVDIKDAYGSILQDKLVEILKETVNTYLGNKSVLQYDMAWCDRGKAFLIQELYRGSYYRPIHSKKVLLVNILKTIENAIRYQTVKWDNKFYLISKGISQAVALSAALCKIYMAHLEKTHLSDFTSGKEDVLLRAVDDFLYITPEKCKAKMFLDKMSHGFSDYGIFINTAKTKSNLSSHLELQYYGYLFNTDNLEVYVKYVNSDNVSFRNLMTFRTWKGHQQEHYLIMKDKMKRITSYKLNKLTTDCSYMSPRGLARNVFKTACLMACCFKAAVRTIFQQFDPLLLMNVINYSAAVVAGKISRLTINAGILKKETYWIVIRAFCKCMLLNITPEENGFPECILPFLEQEEEKAKIRIKLDFRRMVYDIVDEVPLPYRNGH